MISNEVVQVINTIRENKGLPVLSMMTSEMRLREELSLDSLDLAELTVRIEDQRGVDVFADGLVFTVGEVAARISAGRRG